MNTELTVETAEAGFTLLEFLQRRIPAATPGYLRQLLKKGKVTSGGVALTPEAVLTSGALISLPDSGRLQELMAVVPDRVSAIEVLFESRELLVVNKPTGLAVHSSVGHEHDNLTDRVASLLKQRGDQFSVAPVHRLDLETSGPVMFGKGRQACSRIGALFMKNEIEKCYLALVAGKAPGSGVLYSTLTAKGKEKEASSAFLALYRSDAVSLLEVRLFTGRQHQIRRQLAALGHPVLGDSRYGGPCPPEVPRLFLHCSRLSFVDPFSGAAMTIEAPLPDNLNGALSALGGDGLGQLWRSSDVDAFRREFVVYELAADLVVLLHLGFILFVLFGGGLVLVWRRTVWVHLPAVIWGSLVELAGWYCPLTSMEQSLRQSAGETGYRGGFVEHYIVPLIYPSGLTQEMQVLFGTIVLIVNLVVYSLVWRNQIEARKRKGKWG